MPRRKKPKKKGKRPYKMSDKALAQRRVAARKTGEYATSPERQVLPACKESQCPLGEENFPCDLREQSEEKGHIIESCPLPLVFDQGVYAAYLSAIESSDTSGVAELAARSLAAQVGMFSDEMAKLRGEGFRVEVPVYGQDGAIVGYYPKANPRTEPVLRLASQLGHTAEQQAITPKAAGEKKRDEGVGGFLSHMTELQKKFADA